MTGMEIAVRLQLPKDIMEAVENAQPLHIGLDMEKPQNILDQVSAFAAEDRGCRVLRFYLEWAAALKERYDVLGIPEKVFWDGMKDIAIWAEDYRQKHGVPGFVEWGWVAATLSMKVFRLGRLQFEPTQLETAVICDGKTYLPGTPVLGVHIPAGEPLDVAAVREAMQYAPEFFRRHLGKEFALFYCHSWLLSPCLKELLPEDSRILQFQNLFSVCGSDSERQAEERVFGFLAEDPACYPEQTSLQRKMKAALLDGKAFGMGWGVRVLP